MIDDIKNASADDVQQAINRLVEAYPKGAASCYYGIARASKLSPDDIKCFIQNTGTKSDFKNQILQNDKANHAIQTFIEKYKYIIINTWFEAIQIENANQKKKIEKQKKEAAEKLATERWRVKLATEKKAQREKDKKANLLKKAKIKKNKALLDALNLTAEQKKILKAIAK